MFRSFAKYETIRLLKFKFKTKLIRNFVIAKLSPKLAKIIAKLKRIRDNRIFQLFSKTTINFLMIIFEKFKPLSYLYFCKIIALNQILSKNLITSSERKALLKRHV